MKLQKSTFEATSPTPSPGDAFRSTPARISWVELPLMLQLKTLLDVSMSITFCFKPVTANKRATKLQRLPGSNALNVTRLSAMLPVKVYRFPLSSKKKVCVCVCVCVGEFMRILCPHVLFNVWIKADPTLTSEIMAAGFVRVDTSCCSALNSQLSSVENPLYCICLPVFVSAQGLGAELENQEVWKASPRRNGPKLICRFQY